MPESLSLTSDVVIHVHHIQIVDFQSLVWKTLWNYPQPTECNPYWINIFTTSLYLLYSFLFFLF